MAVFEKKIPRKVTLDDTEVLTCTIENTQNIHGHTEYVIRVQRGPSPEKSWHIYKRYKDFVALHETLISSGLNLPLPPKKFLGNMNREFIAERKAALQRYLNIILQNRYLSMTVSVKKFLDPEHYSLPFEEVALQHVSMVLRGEIHCQIIKALPCIGTRLRKHYFLVGSGSETAGHTLLSWSEHGPDKFLDDRSMRAVFKAIASIQHPYIQSIDLAGVNDTGGFVVRRPNPAGSLHDLLVVSGQSPSGNSPKWQQHFLAKYCCRNFTKVNSEEDVGIVGLPEEEIAVYGAQILDALIFLQDRGLPHCGHVHSGNVVISGGVAKLLEVENGILGLPSMNRPFLIRLPKPRQSSPLPQCESETQSCVTKGPLEMADSYCFGRLLYEMATGKDLPDPTMDIVPPVSPSLRSLLEITLTAESCRQGLPSLSELRSKPFFSRVKRESQGHLKLSHSLREAIRAAKMKAEEQFREDQKMLRHQKRLAKVREILNSSDEKKLRKLKQGQSMQEKSPQPSVRSAENSASSSHALEGSMPDLLTPNGRSPEDLRSDSPNSTSTATSAGTVTPSPPPSIPGAPACRGALLGSICNFDRTALRHVSAKSVDGNSR